MRNIGPSKARSKSKKLKFCIKVIPKSSKNLVKEEGGELKVYVSAPPEKGRANRAVIQLLAAHFRVAPRQVKIIVGQTTRQKIVEIT